MDFGSFMKGFGRVMGPFTRPGKNRDSIPSFWSDRNAIRSDWRRMAEDRQNAMRKRDVWGEQDRQRSGPGGT